MCVEILKTTLVTKGPTMGEGGGVMVFVQKNIFDQHESQNICFFLSREATL